MVTEGRSTSTPDLGGVATVEPGLLDTTFDQRRTLVLVAEAGSALSVALVLGRGHWRFRPQGRTRAITSTHPLNLLWSAFGEEARPKIAITLWLARRFLCA